MLAADGDRESLAQSLGECFTQHVASLGDLHQPLQPLLGGEFRLARKELRAPQHDPDPRVPRRRHVEQLVGFLDEDVEQLARIRVRRSVAQPLRERAADVAQREAGEPLVQYHADLGHRFRRQPRGHDDEDRSYHAALEGEHQQQPLRGGLQQLEPLEHGRIERRTDGDAELLRQHTQHLRRALEDLVHRVVLAQPFADLVRLRRRDGRQAHQRVHVHPIGEIGGDPAGGGVGVVQVPLLLQVAHGIADGGGRQGEPEAFRDSATPRRLGGLDVGLDDGLEDLALALVQGCCHIGQALNC